MDVTDSHEVVRAFAKRNYPGSRGVVVCHDEARMRRDRLPIRSSFTHAYPLEVRARVLRDWTRHGFTAPLLSGAGRPGR